MNVAMPTTIALRTTRAMFSKRDPQLRRIFYSSSSSGTGTSSFSNQRQQQLRNPYTQARAHTPKLVDDSLADSVKRGELIFDPAQKRAARRLSRLQSVLHGYCNLPIIEMEQKEAPEREVESDRTEAKKEQLQNANRKEASDVEKSGNAKEKPTMPRGLFLYGEVGTGKTHLMDMFYSEVSVAGANTGRKRRVHFHSFMQDIHQRIHQLKQEDLLKYGRNFSIDTSRDRNPIHRVASQLASEVSILCFDEFQVTDVADALILSQLFSVLFRSGTVIVATSNRHPSTLYEGGLNRSYFLPFIDLLCKYCIVHDMNSVTDYREVITDGIGNYFHLSKTIKDEEGKYECSDNQKKDDEYHEILKERWQNAERHVKITTAFNRTLSVHKVHQNGQFARFHFNELCNKELGSSDYRAIAQNFRAVIIDDIPFLTFKEHDRARRFITLVDELYEANCALMCSAITYPDALFAGKKNDGERGASYSNDDIDKEGIETKIGESFGIDVAQSNGMTAGELASVQELSFAFRRASSRLKEMTSKQFWEKQGIQL